MQRRCKRRKATVLVIALVCLSVVLSLISYMLLDAIRAQRELRRQRDLRQCELLLRAGYDRAELMLEEDASYRGESWHIPAVDIVDRGDARITITITHDSADEPGEIHVVAEYPYGDEQSIRRSTTTPLSATNKE